MFFMMSWDSKADSAVSPEPALILFFKNQFPGKTRYSDRESVSTAQYICLATLRITKHWHNFSLAIAKLKMTEIMPK